MTVMDTQHTLFQFKRTALAFSLILLPGTVLHWITCVFHPKAATHSDANPATNSARNLPPVPIQSLPPIPKQTRHLGGLVFGPDAGQVVAVFSPRCLRIDSPFSSSRCEPLTSRSRIASATVGLPPLK